MKKRIGFVGVGRMGANMARRLKEVGWPVVAVYDGRRNVARSLARELRAEPCATLARVTELSDIILTVVTDDKGDGVDLRRVAGDNLSEKRLRQSMFVQVAHATVSPATHVHVEKLARQSASR